MRGAFRLALMVLPVVLFSCAPKQVIKQEPLGIEEIFKRVNERTASITTLKGKGNISIDSPELSTSGAFQLSLRNSDSLLLLLRGPFGIHVGTLSLTKQRFLFYNGLENTVLSGTPDSATLLSILHIQMPVDRILNAFLGGYSSPHDSLLRFAATTDEYLMAFRNNGRTVEYRIDAATFIVTYFLIKDIQDKVLFKAESSGLTTEDDIAFPTVLRISFPDEGRTVSLVYKEVTINKAVVCAVQVPTDAEVLGR